jgi:hypothetical protein
MLSTVGINESSEEKISQFTAHSLAQHLLNYDASGAGEEEGRAVAKRPLLPLAMAQV